MVPVSAAGQSQHSLAEAARGILEKNCILCHGASQMSGLDMRERETLLRGGLRGPSLIPGRAQESSLYLAAAHIGDLKMPPNQPALPPQDVEALRRWIDAGAPWDLVVEARQTSEPSWWSFRKPERPSVPVLKGAAWVRNPIDAFILVKLEDNGLAPAPRADRRTLIRRAYFDLIGLPPPPEQVESFVKDASPEAYEKLIRDLLASPRYGERWARHWLDLVRYADSSGYESDHYYPRAWRYRDYVIKSFNDDKPYDRFVQEQIAGDELWPDRFELLGSRTIPLKKMEYVEAHVGTGLYTLGPEALESRQDAEQLRYEELSDWADTTGAAFLGLTMGCARCHDHKFDPISQRDYYRFQAIFSHSRQAQVPVVSPMQSVTFAIDYPSIIALDEARIAYRSFEEKVKKRVEEAKKKEFPAEVVQAYEVEKDERTPEQQKLVEPLEESIKSIKLEEALTAQERTERGELYQRLAKGVLKIPTAEGSNLVNFDGLMEVPKAAVLAHFPPEIAPAVHILNRGDFREKEERVEAGLPGVLSGQSEGGESFSPASDRSRSRRQLALWLTRPDHPLTSRVLVNRIWQWHFGQGLVRTPNDFGRQGSEPSHPKLLDWLSTEFVGRGWSIKSLHWLIMLSNTYQMASRHSDGRALEVDPQNALLWRMNRRRLESEALWDALHSVSGTVNLEMYGRPVTPPLTDEEIVGLGQAGRWPESSDPAQHNRRGIYILVRRNFKFPMFEAFDSPQNAVSCPVRDVTSVTPQALWFLNSKVAFEQASAFAARLVEKNGLNQEAWVNDAWWMALGRGPSDQEKSEALELISELARNPAGEEQWAKIPDGLQQIPLSQAAALTKLCLGVFNLNEFIYID